MPSHLKRYHTFGHDHFVTFSCYKRLLYLNNDYARTVFVETLEGLRQRHQFYIFGYVLCRNTFPCGWPIHALALGA